MNVDYPFHFDRQGRTAEASDNDHIRDMIEQVLFTAPGERVNRPGFGSGLRELVFKPNSEELAATTQFLAHSALQEWLGDVIQVDEVHVTSEHERLEVVVRYTIRHTQDFQTAQFVR